MLRKVDGYKSYIVMCAAVIYAIYGVYSGALGTNDALEVVLAALGLGGLRSAITKI